MVDGDEGGGSGDSRVWRLSLAASSLSVQGQRVLGRGHLRAPVA